MTDTAYASALDLLSRDVFEATFTDPMIDGVMADLGVNDAEAAAMLGARYDWLTTGEMLPGNQVTGLLRREFLDLLVDWLPVKRQTFTYSWMPEGLDDDDPNPEFAGMAPTSVIWWDNSLGWYAFDGGRKKHGQAAEWYATAPQDGWLAYAAGLSLEEHSNPDTRLPADALWMLVSLRAENPERVGSARSARRLLAARAAFVAFGGDPDTLTAR